MSQQHRHPQGDQLHTIPAHEPVHEETRTSGIGGDILEIETAATEGSSPQTDDTTTSFLFQSGQDPRQVEFAELPELVLVDENVVWVDLSSSVVQNLEQVAPLLHLHQDAVQTALASWEKPALDVYHAHFFVTATLPRLEPTTYRIKAQTVAFFVGHNYLVSAHHNELPFTSRALQRATRSPDLIKHNSLLLLFILLDELLEHYELLKEQIQSRIEFMEERALIDTSNSLLSELLHFKRYTFALSQLAGQHRPIFTAFLRPDFPQVSGQGVEVYYRDLSDRHTRLEDTFLGAKESINVIFDIYVSHVSHFTNNVMKTLTIVSTVLLPATIILGFFGTNNIQDLPPLTHISGLILMLISIVVSSITILLVFYRKKWLRS